MYNIISIWLVVIIDINWVYGSKPFLTASNTDISQHKLRFTKPNVRSNQQLELRSGSLKELSPRRRRGSSNDQKPYQKKTLDLCNSRSTRSTTRSGLCYSAIGDNEFPCATSVQTNSIPKSTTFSDSEQQRLSDRVKERCKELFIELQKKHHLWYYQAKAEKDYQAGIPSYLQEWDLNMTMTKDECRDVAQWIVDSDSFDMNGLEQKIKLNCGLENNHYAKLKTNIARFIQSGHDVALYDINNYVDESECTRFYSLLSEHFEISSVDQPLPFTLKEIDEWSESVTQSASMREEDKKFLDNFLVKASCHIFTLKFLLYARLLQQERDKWVNYEIKYNNLIWISLQVKTPKEKVVHDALETLAYMWDEIECNKIKREDLPFRKLQIFELCGVNCKSKYLLKMLDKQIILRKEKKHLRKLDV